VLFSKKTKVLMVVSVGDMPAGTHQKLAPELADEFIVKGYAEGELSRDYLDHEVAALKGPTQTVSL
jgi:hypothetical protein